MIRVRFTKFARSHLPTLTLVYYNCRERSSPGLGSIMPLHVTCPYCGVDGSILTEDRGQIPACPRCGLSLCVDVMPACAAAARSTDFDDAVVAWLSEAAVATAVAGPDDLCCAKCGYEGLMDYVSHDGDAVCAACLEVYRRKPVHAARSFHCPDCGHAFEISEQDRGKTIICSGCKRFLGCLLPRETARHWRL
jgi:hypothetical protein